MKISKVLLAFFCSGVLIALSEFLRNEIVFKYLWIAKYQQMGLEFPSAMINNAIWGIWSLLLAGVILVISRKFNLWASTVIVWIPSFFMMWLVIGNLNVLPFNILFFAAPWSLLEVFIAATVTRKIMNNH